MSLQTDYLDVTLGRIRLHRNFELNESASVFHRLQCVELIFKYRKRRNIMWPNMIYLT